MGEGYSWRSRLVTTVMWKGCGSRVVQVLEVQRPEERFRPVDSILGGSQSEHCPKGSCGTGILMLGRFVNFEGSGRCFI